jgi:dienelactone hydrolase
VAAQTLQGADRLAAHTGLLVIQPDFFKGSTPNSAWFPMDSDEKKAAFGAWRKDHADPDEAVKALLEVRKAVGERWPAVDEHVGVFGLCWGG